MWLNGTATLESKIMITILALLTPLFPLYSFKLYSHIAKKQKNQQGKGAS